MSGRDGGPAFPTGAWIGERGVTEGGMSLRDYAAIRFHAAIIAHYGVMESAEANAKRAYEEADAMLATRTGDDA